MAKYELKTKKNDASVEDFLGGIEDENVRTDCEKIALMMEKATGAKPKMWGAGIVGFGNLTHKNTSGSYEWMEIAFAPRKANLTLYLNLGEDRDAELLADLGKHKLGKGCLYFKRLSDVDEEVLEKLIEKSVENIRKVKVI